MERGKPIIFSGPMIKALVEGRKTITRWVLKPRGQAAYDAGTLGGAIDPWAGYERGDRLWVREAVCAEDDDESGDHGVLYLADDAWTKFADEGDLTSDAFGDWWLLLAYRSDDPDLTGGKKVPPIHMPRWASRLTLIVTDVRVERLQDISEEDAKAEGAERCLAGHSDYGQIKTHRTGFVKIWREIHGDESWAENPWVAAISFRVIKSNIDAIAQDNAMIDVALGERA